jgi:hypothetical protein
MHDGNKIAYLYWIKFRRYTNDTEACIFFRTYMYVFIFFILFFFCVWAVKRLLYGTELMNTVQAATQLVQE